MRHTCNFTRTATLQGKSIYLPMVTNYSHDLFSESLSEKGHRIMHHSKKEKTKKATVHHKQLLLGDLVKNPL